MNIRGFSITIGFLLLLGPMPADAADPLTVNPQTTTYDSHPSSATTHDGSVWLAWHGYRNGRDHIFVRGVSAEGELNPLHAISPRWNVHGPPQIVADSRSRVSVVWPAKLDGRWQILLRQFRRGRWLATRRLADAPIDMISPAASRSAEGELLVAWAENLGGRMQIAMGTVDDRQHLDTTPIFSGQGDAFRPFLLTVGSEVWAFWDRYDKQKYSIQAQRLAPRVGRIEQVSPPDEHCLHPTAIGNATGLYVAWLKKQDVIGGPGVISQLHTLHAARRGDSGWKIIETPQGDTAAARLTHGLMAKIEPRVVATGGYLGARTRPMLASDGDRVWLMWERKSNHQGRTPSATGDLVGRPIVKDRWQQPVILSRGRVDYHLVDPPLARDGTVRMLASRLPLRGIRHYELFDLDLDRGEPFQQDEWTGWSPVELPMQSEAAPRRRIIADGKIYNLYWADLHCHNGLTADAEGEPDELHAYARDRAELDVVVFTNNDFYNVPLTQYEFEFGNFLANFYSAQPDSGHRPLLSLPGFEWTSRIPGAPDATLADPGNWLPPYKNRSYPNHRSVIYPPAGGPLVHFTEVENNIDRLNEAVATAGGMTLSQHSAFQLSGHEVEVGLELTSGWSNYIASRPALFHRPLDQGARLGFTANGDTHRRAPGLSGALTGIYAESLSAKDVLEALRARRCFATMGSKIFVDARANQALMGQQTTAVDQIVDLKLYAIGTRVITAAILVRDGEEIHTVAGNGTRELKTTFTDKRLAPGTHWYYWRISQEQTAPVLPGNLMPAHGHLAWSTPHWVIVE